MEVALLTYCVLSVLIAVLLVNGYRNASMLGELPEDMSTGEFVVVMLVIVVFWPLVFLGMLVYNSKKRD
jgi:hypothetical protein